MDLTAMRGADVRRNQFSRIKLRHPAAIPMRAIDDGDQLILPWSEPAHRFRDDDDGTRLIAFAVTYQYGTLADVWEARA